MRAYVLLSAGWLTVAPLSSLSGTANAEPLVISTTRPAGFQDGATSYTVGMPEAEFVKLFGQPAKTDDSDEEHWLYYPKRGVIVTTKDDKVVSFRLFTKAVSAQGLVDKIEAAQWKLSTLNASSDEDDIEAALGKPRLVDRSMIIYSEIVYPWGRVSLSLKEGMTSIRMDGDTPDKRPMIKIDGKTISRDDLGQRVEVGLQHLKDRFQDQYKRDHFEQIYASDAELDQILDADNARKGRKTDDAPRVLVRPQLRESVQNIRMERALYQQFGGRIRVGKGWVSAFDARRRWFESLEASGKLVFLDPALRELFYKDWTPEPKDLIPDDPKHPGIRALLAIYPKPPTTQPSSRRAQ